MNSTGVPSVISSVIISKEYTLELEDDSLKMFLNDRRLKSIGIKTNCKIELTNRILHRKVAPYKIAKHIIICITGPGYVAISQCNRLIETIYPVYSTRKEYSKRAPNLSNSRKESLESNLVLAGGSDEIDTHNVTQYESYLTSNNEIKQKIFAPNSPSESDIGGLKKVNTDICCYAGYKVIHPDSNFKQANLFRSVEYSSCSYVSSSSEQEKEEDHKIRNTPTSQVTDSSFRLPNRQNGICYNKPPSLMNGNTKEFSCYDESYLKNSEENKFNLNLADSFKYNDIRDNLEKEENNDEFDQYYMEKDVPINIPFVFPVGKAHSSVSQTIIFPCAVASFEPSFSNMLVNNNRDGLNSGVHIQDISNMDTMEEALYQKKMTKESLKNHHLKQQQQNLDLPPGHGGDFFETKRTKSRLDSSWATLMSSCCSKPNRVGSTRCDRDNKTGSLRQSNFTLDCNDNYLNPLKPTDSDTGSQNDCVFKLYRPYQERIYNDSSSESSSEYKSLWLNSKYISNYLMEECFANILNDLMVESSCSLLEEIWETLTLTPVLLAQEKDSNAFSKWPSDSKIPNQCQKIISLNDFKSLAFLKDYLTAKHSSIQNDKEKSISLPNVSMDSSRPNGSTHSLQKSLSMLISNSKSQMITNPQVVTLENYRILQSQSSESFDHLTVPVMDRFASEQTHPTPPSKKQVKMYDWDHIMNEYKPNVLSTEYSRKEELLDILNKEVLQSVIEEKLMYVTIPVMTELSDYFYSPDSDENKDDDDSSCVEVDNENLIVCYFQGDDQDVNIKKSSPDKGMLKNKQLSLINQPNETENFLFNNSKEYIPRRTSHLSNEFTVEIEGCETSSGPTVTTNIDLDATLEAFSSRDPLIRAEEEGMLVEIRVRHSNCLPEKCSLISEDEVPCFRHVASRGDNQVEYLNSDEEEDDEEEVDEDSLAGEKINSRFLCFPRKRDKKKNKL